MSSALQVAGTPKLLESDTATTPDETGRKAADATVSGAVSVFAGMPTPGRPVSTWPVTAAPVGG